ncbi:antA/AntB antirepressor family protein [Avibacterium paragallinarum]|nr:antA/AntB antirepressor family protein [Avibacterium paragallinarum]QZP15789.1 antA/AntB antirepressor family protein [Avibacterium paragallinarum]QZP16519.1 antA/AntB antirepressor family protein [Avibacterium paragallinarum]WAL57235.1 antA/AntB antirepressor family protein [Avibacterium paragallinarum]WAM59116.1 antA/AntB antirepressor family protein [Avibacterium paragallinarum]
MTTNTATTNALNLLLEPMKCQFQHKEINGINARNLHQALQIGRDFSTWIKNRIEECSFIEGQDFIIVENLSSPKWGSSNSERFTLNTANANKQLSKARPQKLIDYIITIDMAKHLSLLEKNEIGRAIRQHFIEAERQLAQIAPNLHRNTVERTTARLATIDHNRAMTDAIKDYYQRQGKELKPYHFSNEQAMLDSLVIGENLHHWKARTGVTNVRESFTTKQLSLLKLLQQTNTTLLVLDMPFSQRKSHLTRLIERGAK